MEESPRSKQMPILPLIDLPYAARRLIVVVDDSQITGSDDSGSKGHRRSGGDSATQLAIEVATGVVSNLFPLGFVIGPAIKLLMKSLTQLREEGFPVLPVPRSAVSTLKFLPGHPRDDIMYVGHPAVPAVYYPMAEFHRLTFEHKFAEAVRLLMALGAVKIEVERVTGWSAEFSSKLAVGLQAAQASVGGSAGSKRSGKGSILFHANLDGTATPEVPTDMVWYHHEPTWQQIADGRLKFGLKDFSLTVNYKDDYGINLGLKAKVSKVGLDVGGQFEDHESTVWRIVGKFVTDRAVPSGKGSRQPQQKKRTEVKAEGTRTPD